MNLAQGILFYNIGILIVLVLKGSAIWAWFYVTVTLLYLIFWMIRLKQPPKKLKDKLHEGSPLHLTAEDIIIIKKYPAVFDFSPSKASEHVGIIAQTIFISIPVIAVLVYHGLYIQSGLMGLNMIIALLLRVRVDPRNAFQSILDDKNTTEAEKAEASAFFSAFAKVWPDATKE